MFTLLTKVLSLLPYSLQEYKEIDTELAMEVDQEYVYLIGALKGQGLCEVRTRHSKLPPDPFQTFQAMMSRAKSQKCCPLKN